jgi:hypothetical protein
MAANTPHIQKPSKKNISDQTVSMYKTLCQEVEIKKSVTVVAWGATTELGLSSGIAVGQ